MAAHAGGDTALLQIAGLHAGYEGRAVLHGVDLQLAAGSITTVLGANGAGKSTLLRAICAMVDTRGTVHLAGRRIDDLATEDIARLGLAHVPQGHGTFKDFTTEENLRIGACTRRDRAGVARSLERAYTWFPRLKERRRQRAGTLSGGEQQMLAIARALMLAPRVLLMDEPSSGLAPAMAQEIFAIVHALNHTEHVSVLLVEQNVALALDIAHHGYLMETGRIVLAGSASTLRGDAALQAYLGV